MFQGINFLQRCPFARKTIGFGFYPTIDISKHGIFNKLFQAGTQSVLGFHKCKGIYETVYLAVIKCSVKQTVILYLVFSPCILQLRDASVINTLGRLPVFRSNTSK